MPVNKCPLESCTYETPNVNASLAASLLIINNNVHIYATCSKPKPPKIEQGENVIKKFRTNFC